MGVKLGDYLDSVYGPQPEDTQTCMTVPEPEDDEPYDDAQDHEPCSDCNEKGRGRTPGWYQPFHGPPILCDRCDGAGWV